MSANRMEQYRAALDAGTPALQAIPVLDDTVCGLITAIDITCRMRPWEIVEPMVDHLHEQLTNAQLAREILSNVCISNIYPTIPLMPDVLADNIAHLDKLYPGILNNRLLYASTWGSPELIRALVEHGADIYQNDYACFWSLQEYLKGSAVDDYDQEELQLFRDRVQCLCQISETQSGPRYLIQDDRFFVITTQVRERESYQTIGNRVVICGDLISQQDAAEVLQQYPSGAKSARSGDY